MKIAHFQVSLHSSFAYHLSLNVNCNLKFGPFKSSQKFFFFQFNILFRNCSLQSCRMRLLFVALSHVGLFSRVMQTDWPSCVCVCVCVCVCILPSFRSCTVEKKSGFDFRVRCDQTRIIFLELQLHNQPKSKRIYLLKYYIFSLKIDLN